MPANTLDMRPCHVTQSVTMYHRLTSSQQRQPKAWSVSQDLDKSRAPNRSCRQSLADSERVAGLADGTSFNALLFGVQASVRVMETWAFKAGLDRTALLK
jgi:hypothetical protein